MPANFKVKSRFDILTVNEEPTENTHVVRKTDLDEHVEVLTSALSTEISRASNTETSLDSKIDTAISDLVSTAPETLDTLNELAAALGDDPNLATTITNNIAAETAARESADNVLQSAIDAEESRATAAETINGNAITAEQSRAESAEAALAASVAQEAAERAAADSGISSDLAAEVSRATAAEDANTAGIAAEESRATAAEASLASDLSVEESRASDAEASLASDIATETIRATAAETSLDTKLANETAQRMASDNSINAAIAAETARATAAESANAATINAEKARAQAVEASLSSDLSAEINRAETAEVSLESTISSEVSRAQSAEAANADAIAAETSRATLTEANLDSNKLNRGGEITSGHYKFGTMKLTGTAEKVFLILGKWRIVEKYSTDNDRLIFEYNQGTEENPDWHIGVPFIVCPSTEPVAAAAADTPIHNYDLRSYFDTKLDDSNATFRRHIASNLEGNILVVGGPYQDNTSEDRGEVYIFTYDSFTNTWSSVELLPSSTDTARFGYSVDINDAGTRIVIGAPHHDTQKGRAYVFDYDGSNWIETAILESDPITIGDNLSYRVAMSGDGNRIAASATGYDIVGDGSLNSHNDVGATYVFDYDSSAWSQTVKLLTDDPTHNEVVGTEMKMSKDGSTIVAGSYYSNVDNNPFAGAAYVFKEVSGVWSQSTKLYDSTPRPLDFYSFTADVTRDGNKVVIGVFGDDLTEINGQPGVATDYGSLFIYNYDGTTWTEEDKIDASDKFDYTRLQFGGSVSMNDDGDTIAVGAIVVDGEPYYNGGVYIYKKIDSVWTEKQKIVTDTPDKGAYDTFFAYDLAFNGSGSKLFITAIMSSNVGSFDRVFNYNLN